MHAARADGLDPDAVLARPVGSRPARRPWLGITTRPRAWACHLSRRDENRPRPPAARWRRYPRPPRPPRCSSPASCQRRPAQPCPSLAHAGHRPRTWDQKTRSRPASRDGADGGDAVRDAAITIAEQARPEAVTADIVPSRLSGRKLGRAEDRRHPDHPFSCGSPATSACPEPTPYRRVGARLFGALARPLSSPGMAYWMIACSVYLYITTLGVNVRICRPLMPRGGSASAPGRGSDPNLLVRAAARRRPWPGNLVPEPGMWRSCA
jgi:hypothetical protein